MKAPIIRRYLAQSLRGVVAESRTRMGRAADRVTDRDLSGAGRAGAAAVLRADAVLAATITGLLAGSSLARADTRHG